MTTTPATCACGHLHESAMQEGVVWAFHRCRMAGCDCNEFRPQAPDADGAAGVRDAWSVVDAAIEAHASARHQATLVTGEVCPSPRRYSDELLRTHSALEAAVRAYGDACGAAQARAAEALRAKAALADVSGFDEHCLLAVGNELLSLRARLAEAEGKAARYWEDLDAADNAIDDLGEHETRTPLADAIRRLIAEKAEAEARAAAAVEALRRMRAGLGRLTMRLDETREPRCIDIAADIRRAVTAAAEKPCCQDVPGHYDHCPNRPAPHPVRPHTPGGGAAPVRDTDPFRGF